MCFRRVYIFCCLCLSVPVVAAEPFPFSRSLPAGGHYEQCMTIETGQRLGWRFSSSQMLSFNVHSHPDDATVYHLRIDSSADEGAFQSPRSGVYCVMWENDSGLASDLSGTLTQILD